MFVAQAIASRATPEVPGSAGLAMAGFMGSDSYRPAIAFNSRCR